MPDSFIERTPYSPLRWLSGAARVVAIVAVSKLACNSALEAPPHSNRPVPANMAEHRAGVPCFRFHASILDCRAASQVEAAQRIAVAAGGSRALGVRRHGGHHAPAR